MRFLVLAVDYDGTLASEGVVSAKVIAALGCSAAGRSAFCGDKDDELPDEVAAVEQQPTMPVDESRRTIRRATEKHYTLPAFTPDGA